MKIPFKNIYTMPQLQMIFWLKYLKMNVLY